LRALAIGSAGALLAACQAPASPPPPAATAAPVPTQPPPVAKPAPTQAPAEAKPAAPAAPTAAAAQPKPTSAPAVQVPDASFVVVDGTEPASLDPAIGTGPFQHPIQAMYDGLVAWNEKMEAVPSLATAWEPSADGKAWTFKLRSGIKFHDGSPFNSQAVKATIDHILDKDTASGRRSSYTLIKEVQTPDDGTVRFVTDPPTPDFPFLMADGSAKIISPTALQKFGKDLGRNPVGTGPYKFVEWVPNQHVVAEVNPDYWGPKPKVKRFVYRPIPEASGRVVALRTGEADVVLGIPPADVEALKGDSNLTIQITPGLTIVEAEPAQSKPPFDDLRVRQALNMALDKDAMIKSVMRGMAYPLNSPSIPGLWGTFDFEPVKFDPDGAKKLLAEAGYPNGHDITMIYTSGRWPGDDQIAEAMQGYWNNVGLRTTLRKVAEAERTALTRTNPDTRAGQLGFFVKTSAYVDYHLFRMYHSSATNIEGTAQRTAYGNPQVDKLIEQEQATFDPEKRLPILKQAQELIWKDQPLVFLFLLSNIWGQRKNVSGFKFIPSNEIVPFEVQKA
jgi:ABC-type transport system substrate-binding protein